MSVVSSQKTPAGWIVEPRGLYSTFRVESSVVDFDLVTSRWRSHTGYTLSTAGMARVTARGRVIGVAFDYTWPDHPDWTDPMDERGLVRTAMNMARRAHYGQRYGEQPYIEHCLQVAALCEGADPEVTAAAWLHDSVEDASVDVDDIADAVSPRVGALVWACTGVGQNRRARNAEIERKLLAEPAAVGVKLADRFVNVSTCWETRDTRLFMYRQEHDDFRRLLRDTGWSAHPHALALDRLLGGSPNPSEKE